MDVINAVLHVLFLLLMGGGAYWWYRRNRQSGVRASTIETCFANAGGRVTRIEEGETVRYSFLFQDGHFIFSPDGDGWAVLFPAFMSAERDEYDAVANLVNRASRTYEGWNFFYHYDEDDNSIYVDLATRFTIAKGGDADESFINMMRAFFALRTNFVSTYRQEGQKNTDIEEMNERRERFLSLRRELAETDNRDACIGRADTPLALGGLLKLLGMDMARQWTRLEVVGAVPLVLTSPAEIAAFDVSAALIGRGEGETLRFLAPQATLIVTFEDFEIIDRARTRQLVVQLSQEHADESALFFRATFSEPARTEEGTAMFARGVNRDFINTLLLAVDNGTLEQRMAEANYMWQDAKDKMAEDKEEELTEEQRSLYLIDEQPLARNLYWGRRCALSSRYAEAILHLENAFDRLKDDYFTLSSGQKNIFMEVVYHLAFCYNEIGHLRQAFYFIDLLTETRQMRYVREVVNVLLRAHDLRGIFIIDSYLEEIEKTLEGENPEEMPNAFEDAEVVRGFLLRGKASLLVHFARYEAAEKLLGHLLKREDSKDFAQNLLKKIETETSQTDDDETQR